HHVYALSLHDALPIYYFRPMQEYFIHAGISGVPHGARVTEVIRKVQSGEAAPVAQSADAVEPTPPAELREPLEMSPIAAGTTANPVGSVGVPEGDSGFELADDDDEDDAFDTSTSETSKTGAEEFWRHLDPPTETKKQEVE